MARLLPSPRRARRDPMPPLDPAVINLTDAACGGSYTKRTAASKSGKCQPESGRARPSLSPARRTASRRGQKVGSSPALRYRAPFRPSDRPPQSASRVLGRAAKQWEPAWGVVDDLPEDIPVLPRELKVIEMFLAAILDESLRARRVGDGDPASEIAKRNMEKR